MVNYLSMFLESLQMILVPIYNLTRKTVKFQWDREQQEAFQKIDTVNKTSSVNDSKWY